MTEHGPPTVEVSPDTTDSVGVFQVAETEGVRQWRATGGRLTIGSHPSNHVVLAEPTVSRFHCELTEVADGVWVTDLASRNGTLVDGIRVDKAQVRHGHVLRLGRASLRFERLAEREALDVSPRSAFGGLVGSSLAMRAVFASLEKASRSDATVLLEGETGTGKGAIAEALHASGARAKAAFVAVDCGALTPGLLDSELAGAFEEAAGGTIFLDEVGELPVEMQPRLSRVLESRAARVIAATNRDLRALVNDGRFRADLYYRLAVVRVHVPALRERASDLPELAAALLRALGASAGQLAALTAPEMVARLAASAWPGNVRELRNYLERSLVLDGAPVLDAPIDATAMEPLPDARRRALDAFERRYLEQLMQRHAGKVSAAARTAGVARVYLYRLLAKYGIKPG